jgi:hypothetical protein
MPIRRALVCLFIFSAASLVLGQGRHAPSQQYNPATETTISGVVQDVFHPSGRNSNVGTHFNLKTDSGIIEVHAGPQWFLTQQGFSLEQGSHVTVTGSKQAVAGKDALIARELKSGDKVLTLRDANGIPKWSRGRAGNN